MSVGFAPRSIALRAPAPAVVAARARQLADQIGDAVRRIGRAGDGAALHDFRVSLRRLRSWLRLHRGVVDVPRTVRRRLRRLAEITGAQRDREAALERLEEWRADMDGAERRAARIVATVWRRAVDADRRIGAECRRRWRTVAPRLRTALAKTSAVAPPYGPTVARLLAAQHAALVGAESDAHDVAGLHRARIEAKRLRYLLEPLVAQATGAAAAVHELELLQDYLGEITDCAAMAGSIETLAVEDAGRRIIDAAAQGVVARAPDLVHAGEVLAAFLARRLRTLLARRAADCAARIAGLAASLEPLIGRLTLGDGPS